LSILGNNVILTAELTRFSTLTNFEIQVKKIKNPSETGAIKNFKLNITSNSVLYIQEKVPAKIIITESTYMINATNE